MGGVSPSRIGFERAARTHKMTHLTFILFFGLLLFSRHLSQRRRRTKPTPRLQEPKTVAATILVSLCEFTCVCVYVGAFVRHVRPLPPNHPTEKAKIKKRRLNAHGEARRPIAIAIISAAGESSAAAVRQRPSFPLTHTKPSTP